MKGRPLNVLIAEPIPSSNKGEAAIFKGIQEALASRGAVRLTLCSHTPRSDSEEYGPETTLLEDNVVRPGGRLSKASQAALLCLRHMVFAFLYLVLGTRAVRIMRGALWKAYLSSDVILLGHDNVLVGRLEFNLCAVALLGRVLKKPVAVYAGTVGPFSGRLTPPLVRWLLGHVDSITLRESTSLRNLSSLGMDPARATVTADPAFLLRPATTARVDELLLALQLPAGAPLVCVTTTKDMGFRYAASRGLPRNAGCRAYLELRARALDSLSSERGAAVLLLPHCVEGDAERNDDLTNRELYDLIRDKTRVRVVDPRLSAAELKGLIGRSELLLGDRTHSMIAAASTGTPLLGTVSTLTASKTRGIIGNELGLEELLLDVERLEEKDLLARIAALWDHRAEMRRTLEARAEPVKRRAQGNGGLVWDLAEAAARATGRP